MLRWHCCVAERKCGRSEEHGTEDKGRMLSNFDWQYIVCISKYNYVTSNSIIHNVIYYRRILHIRLLAKVFDRGPDITAQLGLAALTWP